MQFTQDELPVWVPESVFHYLQHTEEAQPIRQLARVAGCCASTILRQVRKVEARRDDPLVDAALSKLARAHRIRSGNETNEQEGNSMTAANHAGQKPLPDAAELSREGMRVLRRLCEPGSVLAVAEQMEKAVVVREDDSGSTRTAAVDARVAEAMALKGWINCTNPGRISRYFITTSGRAALSRMLAEQENRMRAETETGFAETAAGFDGRGPCFGDRVVDDPEDRKPRRVRYNMAESPLTLLARRKDRDGRPFLEDKLVHAGERLREDFELAQMGPTVGQNWDRFLTGGARGGFKPDSGVAEGPSAARARVAKALGDLGPGLSDVVLRCCCFLEGLETAEKRLGWSARSGKIVLRIALQRLHRHYDEQAEPDRLIG
ncbi:MAG: DUF6456 domain-containing protein [Arenibacterium sp.]